MTPALLVQEGRKKAGLTQLELAKRAKIPQQYISLIESGKARNTTVKTLERLSKACGMRLEVRLIPNK
jgi:transcriptional regulator with XRE-family HTH domain